MQNFVKYLKQFIKYIREDALCIVQSSVIPKVSKLEQVKIYMSFEDSKHI